MFTSFSQNDSTLRELIKREKQNLKIRNNKYDNAFEEIDSAISKKRFLMYLNLLLFISLMTFIYIGLQVGHFKD